MCGRFTSYHSRSEIADIFNLIDVPQLEPRYNIAPTQQVAAIVHSDGIISRQFKWLRWGLIPHWAAQQSIGNRLINARAETVAHKPSFRSAFRHRRCLIIADGFYEWQQKGNGKQPFYIQQIDRSPFAFAGLWSTWTAPDGEIISTCTIITTSANEFMMPIHKRMPVILNSLDYDLWLDSSVQKPELYESLLLPNNSYQLKASPVSTKVNNARNDTPECLKLIKS